MLLLLLLLTITYAVDIPLQLLAKDYAHCRIPPPAPHTRICFQTHTHARLQADEHNAYHNVLQGAPSLHIQHLPLRPTSNPSLPLHISTSLIPINFFTRRLTTLAAHGTRLPLHDEAPYRRRAHTRSSPTLSTANAHFRAHPFARALSHAPFRTHPFVDFYVAGANEGRGADLANGGVDR